MRTFGKIDDQKSETTENSAQRILQIPSNLVFAKLEKLKLAKQKTSWCTTESITRQWIFKETLPFHESRLIEFKEVSSEGIVSFQLVKSVIAMLNSLEPEERGLIFLGVDGQSRILGTCLTDHPVLLPWEIKKKLKEMVEPELTDDEYDVHIVPVHLVCPGLKNEIMPGHNLCVIVVEVKYPGPILYFTQDGQCWARMPIGGIYEVTGPLISDLARARMTAPEPAWFKLIEIKEEIDWMMPYSSYQFKREHWRQGEKFPYPQGRFIEFFQPFLKEIRIEQVARDVVAWLNTLEFGEFAFLFWGIDEQSRVRGLELTRQGCVQMLSLVQARLNGSIKPKISGNIFDLHLIPVGSATEEDRDTELYVFAVEVRYGSCLPYFYVGEVEEAHYIDQRPSYVKNKECWVRRAYDGLTKIQGNEVIAFINERSQMAKKQEALLSCLTKLHSLATDPALFVKLDRQTIKKIIASLEESGRAITTAENVAECRRLLIALAYMTHFAVSNEVFEYLLEDFSLPGLQKIADLALSHLILSNIDQGLNQQQQKAFYLLGLYGIRNHLAKPELQHLACIFLNKLINPGKVCGMDIRARMANNTAWLNYQELLTLARQAINQNVCISTNLVEYYFLKALLALKDYQPILIEYLLKSPDFVWQLKESYPGKNYLVLPEQCLFAPDLCMIEIPQAEVPPFTQAHLDEYAMALSLCNTSLKEMLRLTKQQLSTVLEKETTESPSTTIKEAFTANLLHFANYSANDKGEKPTVGSRLN
jgi:Putative DNA-binding domain